MTFLRQLSVSDIMQVDKKGVEESQKYNQYSLGRYTFLFP